MKKLFVFHISLIVFTTILCVLLLAFNKMDFWGLMITLVPLYLSSIFTVFIEYSSYKRSKKIKALKYVKNICKYLIEMRYENISINLCRTNRIGLPPIPFQANINAIINEKKQYFDDFFKEFNLNNQKDKLMEAWGSDLDKMTEFLNKTEEKLNLTEDEFRFLNETSKK